MTAPILSVRDLQTEFRTESGTVKAVDRVSFSLERGQILGVVGESGSGKSVTALSILRLIPTPPGRIAAGTVELDGVDLLKLPEREMRALRGRRISMIFQDPMTSLNPFLTVERQLTEVLEVHQNQTRREAKRASIHMLERVGIPAAEKRIRDYPHQFSGGMRQRVMIAMALLCEPRLLIADEPTTALDVTTQAQILDLIAELRENLGTSVLLITHDLGVVAGMADQVAVMYAGKVVEYGDAFGLFDAPAHPYTIGLLRSIPRLTGDRPEELVPIEGLPPNLAELGPGCAFAPRCARATARCVAESPKPNSTGDGRRVACWHPESQPAPGPAS